MLDSQLNFAEQKVNTEGRAAETASGTKVFGYLLTDLFIVAHQTVSADDAIKTETAVTEALIIASFKARNAQSTTPVK